MDRIVIRMGGYQAPQSVHTRAARRFGEALAAHLPDRVSYELVPDVLALGRMSGHLPEMVASGELSACYISTVRFAQAVPAFKLLELPFVVSDRGKAQAALQGDLLRLLARGMEENTAFRLLGLWDNGFRHFTNKVRPIREPADCAGLRIRSQVSDLHVQVFRALGFEPIPVDIKEFTEQVATDRFQAQENPLTNTYNFGVHRHHRYITLSGHLFGAAAFICNAEAFRGWPADVQRGVEKAAVEATAHQHDLAAAEDEEILARIDPRENEVIRPTAAEHAAFVRAVEPVLARHRADLDPRLFDYLG